MHKTESEAATPPKPSNWQRLLTNIEQSLRTLTEGVSTPLALNMKMLALLADMEHADQLLEALLVQWRTALPFVTDQGMEVDWDEAALRIHEAAKTLKGIGRKMRFPQVIVDCPPKEGAWRSWQYELTYRREEGEPRDIFAPDYGCRLNPTLKENLWYVTADYITRYRETYYRKGGDKATYWYPFNLPAFGGLRETMCHLSPEPHVRLAVMLRSKVTQLTMLCTSLAQLLIAPNLLFFFDDIEKVYAEFHDRLYERYAEDTSSIDVINLHFEMTAWRSLYAPEGDISPLLATNRLATAYGELETSGFADDWLAAHGLQNAQPNARQRALHQHFFTDDGAVHSSRAGRYLFALQRMGGDSEQRIRAFMRYAYIYKELLRYLAPQQRVTLTADEEHVRTAIASVVEQGIITCDADWIAIYLVLNEREEAQSDYTQFYERMRRMGFAERFKGATPKQVCDSLRKAYEDNVSGNGSTDKWADILKEMRSHGKGRALWRYHKVATALKTALATTDTQG